MGWNQLINDQLIVTKLILIGKKVVPRLLNTKHVPSYTRTYYCAVAHNPAVTVPFSSYAYACIASEDWPLRV